MGKDKKPNKRIGCWSVEDFDFVYHYYLDRIKDLQQQSKDTDSEKLLQTSKEAFYLNRFLYDMKVYSYYEIADEMAKRFKEKYGTETILIDIQNETFDKVIKSLSGQHLLGENEYLIHNQQVYYRSLIGKWFNISADEAFLLFPKLDNPVPDNLIEELEKQYKETKLDLLYRLWLNKNWTDKINESNINIQQGITTSNEYFKTVINQIKAILQNPTLLSGIKQYFKQEDDYIERLIKVNYRLIEYTQAIRKKTTLPIYLLRDGMLFAEAHKTIDFLLGEDTPSCQLMIGRSVLSTPEKKEYYWALSVDAFYAALRKHPDNFDLFFDEYSSNMNKLEKEHPDLADFLQKLADYIYRYIKDNINKQEKIVVADVGLQGSIVLLTKYLIDKYLKPKENSSIQVETYMFIVGSWLKGIHNGRYHSDYYPMMKDIEPLVRSEQLYSYVEGSFAEGDIKVKMGTKDQQLLANLELIIMVQLCLLMKESNLL